MNGSIIDGAVYSSDGRFKHAAPITGMPPDVGIGKIASLGKNTSKVLLNTSKKLQSKYKHAIDFGLVGKCNRANAAKFSAELNQHINAAGTQIIQGVYRNANNQLHFI